VNTAVKLQAAEKGGYAAYVPSLHGGISEVDTFEEAVGNIKKLWSFILEKMIEMLFGLIGGS